MNFFRTECLAVGLCHIWSDRIEHFILDDAPLPDIGDYRPLQLPLVVVSSFSTFSTVPAHCSTIHLDKLPISKERRSYLRSPSSVEIFCPWIVHQTLKQLGDHWTFINKPCEGKVFQAILPHYPPREIQLSFPEERKGVSLPSMGGSFPLSIVSKSVSRPCGLFSTLQPLSHS